MSFFKKLVEDGTSVSIQVDGGWAGVPSGGLKNKKAWCYENIGKLGFDWTYYHDGNKITVFYFMNSTDAVAFKIACL